MRAEEKTTWAVSYTHLDVYKRQQLGVWIDKHNEIKDELVEIWSFDDSCFEAVMNNWNSKYLYMNNQYKKRLSYLKALQKAMGSVQF